MSIIEDYKVLVKNGTEKILSNGGEIDHLPYFLPPV